MPGNRSRFFRVLETAFLLSVGAILVVAPTQFGLEVWKNAYLSLADPLVWLALGLWFLLLLGPGRRMRLVFLPPVSAVLLVAWCILSITRAGNRLDAAKDVFQYVEYFVAAWLVFGAGLAGLGASGRLRLLFLGVATAVVAGGVLQYLLPGIEDFAVRSSFGNRNVLGGYFSLVLPLFLGLFLCDARALRRTWYGAVILGGLAANLSGGSLLATAIACAVISRVRGRAAFIGVVAAGVGLVLLGGIVLPRENAQVVRESVTMFREDGFLKPRYPEWQAALTMAEENPVLGVGAGNYQDNIGMYFGSIPRPGGEAGKAEPDSQNQYLVLASSVGWPGLVFLFALLLECVLAAAAAYRRLPPGPAQGWALGLLGSLLAVSISAIWSPVLIRGIGLPLVFVLCLCAHAARSLPPSRTHTPDLPSTA